MLWDWVEDGSFIQDKNPCYYIYQLTMDGRTQTGICACASIEDYENGVIKKHENTRAEKEQDRIRHVDTCIAMIFPFLLLFSFKFQNCLFSLCTLRCSTTFHSPNSRIFCCPPDFSPDRLEDRMRCTWIEYNRNRHCRLPIRRRWRE